MMSVKSVVFAIALVGFAGCARATDLSKEPGRWSAWNFRTYVYSEERAGLTRDDTRALGAQLKVLDDLIRRTPPAAQPIGFSCQSWGTGETYMVDIPGRPTITQLPIKGGVTFGAFHIFEYERNGKKIREDGGETQLMTFEVNNLEPRRLSNDQIPDEWRELPTDAFLMPEQTGTVAGFPRYGDYILIKRKADPIWLPMSMEAALRLTTESAKQKAASAREMKARPDYQQKLDATVAKLEARIAGLSPADRGAPACWVNSSLPPIDERVQKSPSQGCTPVVVPNWGFFDLKLPRSTPQVVLVTSIGRCYQGRQDSSVGGCTVNRKLLEALDRQALMNWLH
jgi:hypothetical protein